MGKNSLGKRFKFILCIVLFVSIVSSMVVSAEATVDGVNAVDEAGEKTAVIAEEETATEAEDETTAVVEGEAVMEAENEAAAVPEEEAVDEAGEKNMMAAGLVNGIAARAASPSINLGSYNGGGTITLTGNTTANGQCQLSGELTIDLNGYELTMGQQQSFMMNGPSAVLNIRDSKGSGRDGIIYAAGQFVWGYNGGTFNLYGGILDGSKAASKAQMGGCVWLFSGMGGNNVFQMYGGTIRNFEATQYGGAVFVGGQMHGRTHTFTMYGGVIENCYAPQGSAVYVDGDHNAGYFYMKGGESADGESKAVIRCATYNGKKVSNAIYNYGYFGIEGVIDLDGIVYMEQNNWASTVTHFIKVTGRLVVVGDGYIDIDSAYPNRNAICTGHTVVENVTQTVGGMDVTISQKEFFTYSSYFINSTKGLMVSAGFDPTKQEISGGGPANWPGYQADEYNQTYTYIDVLGHELLIQASDSPGDKRQMQNYNYLIYTDRADPSKDYAQFYSIKISKQDIDGKGPLNGATFRLKKQVKDESGEISYEQIGTSGSTGDATGGMESGETYIYLAASADGKLMIDDGTYVLEEVTAPEGYVARGDLVTIEITHKMDESTGQLVSVVEVKANHKVLTTEEQVINSTYGDSGWLVEREVVLYLKNSATPLDANRDYKIQIEKYQDDTYTTPLANAEFVLNTTTEPITGIAGGMTDENGVLRLRDKNGSEFTFSNGDSFQLKETGPPEDYYVMDDEIALAVNDKNELLIDGSVIADGGTVTMEASGAAHGSWTASLSGNLLTFRIYDEKKPPTWTLKARKYGTQVNEALALAGAKFTLYKLETVGEQTIEKEVATATSSDGVNGSPIGTLQFVDGGGVPLEFDCNATYLLREIAAPMGYELTNDILFQINEDGSQIQVTQKGESYSGASYDAVNQMVTLSIVDKAVYHMPETAGRGSYPVVLAGIMLMCIHGVGIILLLYKRSGICRK